MKDITMPFMQHLIELRSRLIKSLYALAVGALVGLIFCKKIYAFLQIPMLKALPEGSFFITTSPFESYMTFFKVALLAGIFLASPFIFYQIWRFAEPGLEEKEKKLLVPFALISALLFVGGALFGYFVVFPAGFYYVNLILEGTAIRMMPNMNDYLDVAFALLLAFGVTFELPLVIVLLGKLGLIDYRTIKHYRRYVIVFLFLLAGVLTPGPDVLSQILLAVPLCLLYELGGIGLLLTRGRKNRIDDAVA